MAKNNELKESQIKDLMNHYTGEEISSYLSDRKEYLDTINEIEDNEIKEHYLNVINSMDNSFNDDNAFVRELKVLMEKVKDHKESFQALSFCVCDGGNESIIIRTFENSKSEKFKDCGIYYQNDLTEIRQNIFKYDEGKLEEDYDFYLSDFMGDMSKFKASSQVYRCVKKATKEFDFTKLNIKYPLEIYIDHQGDEMCDNLIIKINK